MTPDQLDAILAVVRDAAREAGAFVLEGFRKGTLAEHKGAVDLVTRYDRESEVLLRASLGALPFPIVGEELASADVPPGEACLYVDPIDGTTNFVHGHPFWCISIGLVVGGLPTLGVVLAPALDLEWFGWVVPPEAGGTPTRRALRRSARGALTGAAVLLEEPCTPSSQSHFSDAMLATGFPYDRRTSTDNNFDAFVALKRRCQAIRRCGSAAIDLCLVADGTYDGYWERKLKPWDLAGGSAIVRAAGGRVTDFEQTGAFLASGHVVASNGVLHDTLTAELAAVASLRAPTTDGP